MGGRRGLKKIWVIEERRLSWDTMQQIRYLKQKLPEEWTVDHMAEGFSFHRDIVTSSSDLPRRVLPGGGGGTGEEEKDEQMERWDGTALSEEELEALMQSTKPWPVVHYGKLLFSSEGNFLYRI
ncbi:neugrin-like [Salvelinus fontinalis]|uniref:neugrin-like n=1 Tax=Salvelinus fontinalis TaxID=8038 RepID=UPI0024867766|nr:neugrin-like [Salvelinus fontinalis]